MRTLWLISTLVLTALSFAVIRCSPSPATQLDFDGDGVTDSQDAFPTNPAEQHDTDSDGVGDHADALPTNPTETLDTDGDGQGNNADTDDDDDGLADASDPDPIHPADPATLPPPNPLGGDPGMPVPTLTAQEVLAFNSGKTSFGHMYQLSEGVRSNAFVQSCNGCHSQPVDGGSGQPRSFQFRMPNASTTFFVQRNVVAMFGLGAFERVSDSDILSRQDFVDSDGDGISGRVNVDGTAIGRFGSKAQAATIENITREMLLDQLGITSDPLSLSDNFAPQFKRGILDKLFDAIDSISFATPAYAQITPPDPGGGGGGGNTPDDNIPDPEINEADLRLLVAFTANLATPIRATIDDAVVRGEETFATLGCAKCHVPTLMTSDGLEIHPYTDLLLHDMGFENYDGVIRGAAGTTEFRTAPLWGLHSASYFWHDARATTIEQAIAAHAGEATAIRDSFTALPQTDQQDLLDFLNSL